MINNVTRNKWIWALIIFAVIGVILTLVLRLITPHKLVVPKTEFLFTNQASRPTSFSNIRFTGNFSQAVSSLSIASIQSSQTTLDYIRDNLIEKYGLQQVVGLSSVWQGDEFTLSYNPYTDDFKFSYWPESAEDASLVNPAQGIEAAEQFVRDNFPNLGLAAQREAIRYFKGPREYEETTRDQATSMQVDFTYTIEGTPVYLEHERSAVVVIAIDSQNIVRSASFQPYFVNFAPTEQKISVISLETALENINSHSEAAIIYAFDETVGAFTMDQIESGELKTVRLEYRADLEQGLAYPFYRFSGELINEDGQTIQAEIITPAVAVQE